MYGEIKFMNGIDPISTKERELAIAEKRSHSAKNAHKRRRDKREALLQSQNAHRPLPKPPGSSRDGLNEFAGEPLHRVELSVRPRRSTPYITWSSDQESRSDESQSSAATTPESTVVPYTRPSYVSSVPRQPHTNIRLVFNNADRLQAFEFWLKVACPATARYASPYGEVWRRIVPQFAMASSTVRHMLLAHAYIFAKFSRAFSADANTFEARGFYHYSKGVKEMCTKVSGKEFLVATKLGYVFEAMQENYDRAVLHLKGCEAILSNYNEPRDEDFKLLVASHDVANTITSILRSKGVKKHYQDSPQAILWEQAPFDTTDEARQMIGSIIERIGDGWSLSDVVVSGEIKTSLRIWSGTLRKWDTQDAPSAKRSALLLLFNLATALLPSDEVGRLSQATSPHLIQYILKSAVEYLDNQRKMNVEDRKDLMRTLRMLADYIIRFVQLPEYQERSRSLMDRIESEDEGFFP